MAPPDDDVRTLDLVTVKTGHTISWSRDEIHDPSGRQHPVRCGHRHLSIGRDVDRTAPGTQAELRVPAPGKHPQAAEYDHATVMVTGGLPMAVSYPPPSSAFQRAGRTARRGRSAHRGARTPRYIPRRDFVSAHPRKAIDHSSSETSLSAMLAAVRATGSLTS